MANDTTTEDRGAANKALILAISIPVVLFTILGILAKFFIAKGIHIPYLAP